MTDALTELHVEIARERDRLVEFMGTVERAIGFADWAEGIGATVTTARTGHLGFKLHIEANPGISVDAVPAKRADDVAPAEPAPVDRSGPANPQAAHMATAWTVEEVATVERILTDGGTPTDAYEALGGKRSRQAVKTKCASIRKRLGLEPAPPREPRAGHLTNLGHAPWTDDEIATVFKILDEGGTARDVREALPHRSERAVEQKCQKVRKELREAAEQPAEETPAAAHPPPEARPEPEPALVERLCPSVPKVCGGKPYVADAQPAQPIRKAMTLPPTDDFWTRERDLDLVQSLSAGAKLPAIAQRFGRDVDDLRKRWRALCPGEVTWDKQQKLLRALKERVAA